MVKIIVKLNYCEFSFSDLTAAVQFAELATMHAESDVTVRINFEKEEED